MKTLVDTGVVGLSSLLRSAGYDVEEVQGRSLTTGADLGSAEVLIVRSTCAVGASLLEGSGVRLVVTATAGTDHIDQEYCASRGVAVASAPGSNANAVAEYAVLAVLLEARRRNCRPADLAVGIVGYGNVGRRTAHHLRALGVNVAVSDPPLEELGGPLGITAIPLRDLCSFSDILCTHVPLTVRGRHATEGLLGSPHFAAMRPGSAVVHLCRGGVVIERELLSYLAPRRLHLYCDVWEAEPRVSVRSILAAEIATPHIAGHTLDAKLAGSRMAARAWSSYTGRPLPLELLSAPPGAEFGGYLCEQELLDTLMLHRNLWADDGAMRSWCALGSDVLRGEAFDAYRRSYPVRREYLPDPFPG